ncbi:tripartite tricarboxylate transporter TctB family protein [Mycobacterium sp. AMU20-3851]|uniref:tripartite tricarboxylate transporter TctB family protein n=1 Tax=Mycobacterium sp. AMU20-3851 TaxID=3122055 RepID=UPI003754E4CD
MTPDPVVEQSTREPNHRGYEVAVGIAVAALGAACLVLTDQLELSRDGGAFGPRWWPTALSIAIIAIGVVLVVQAVISRVSSDEPRITRSGGVTLAATVSAIIGYGIAWQYLDFRAVTVALLIGLTFLFGGRGIKALIVFPLVTTLILWAIFGLLLRVPL